MGSRLELQTRLESAAGLNDEGEANKVYFQPPQNVGMAYPCIVYQRSYSYISHADNLKYWRMRRYSVTVIDRNPDSSIIDAVEDLPYTQMDRQFVVDGLYHTVFQTYF